MMKDEADNIHYMLDRYKPKPDIVAVNINNTTDNTIDVLTKYCERHKIQLRYNETKFYNYSENRNIALQVANEAIRCYYDVCPTGPLTVEEMNRPYQADEVWYTHMVDADNLTLDDKVNPDSVDENDLDHSDLGTVNLHKYLEKQIPADKKQRPTSFSMTIISGSKYSTHNLFEMHLHGYNGFVYMCPVHEVATSKGWNDKQWILKGCYIKRGQRGDRSRDSQTYFKDALNISQHLNQGKVSPTDRSRMTFYCAQSYRDAKLYSESMKYYRMRAEDDRGYYSERFMSYRNMYEMISWITIDGRSPYSKDEIELKKLEYISAAYNITPSRWDALVPLFDFYYDRKMYKIAWAIAKPYVKMTEVPSDLFVNISYYHNPKTYERFVLAAHYSKDDETAKELINIIAKSGTSILENQSDVSKIIGMRKMLI